MSIKFRVNASRIAYRRAKCQQLQNSYHLQDLIASQLKQNASILKKAERSFDRTQLGQISELNDEDDTKAVRKQFHQEMQENKMYQQFREKSESMNELLELQKLTKWKNLYCQINLTKGKQIKKVVMEIFDLKDHLRNGYFTLHSEHKKKQSLVIEFNLMRKQEKAKLTENIKKLKRKTENNESEVEGEKQKQSEEENEEIIKLRRQFQQMLKNKYENIADYDQKIDNIKRENKDYERKIQKNKQFLKQILKERSIFLFSLLHNQFYQQNGLLWIFQELHKNWQQIQILCQDNEELCIFSSVQVQRLYQSNYQLENEYFPKIFDHDSKRILQNFYYSSVKLEKKNISDYEFVNDCTDKSSKSPKSPTINAHEKDITNKRNILSHSMPLNDNKTIRASTKFSRENKEISSISININDEKNRSKKTERISSMIKRRNDTVNSPEEENPFSLPQSLMKKEDQCLQKNEIKDPQIITTNSSNFHRNIFMRNNQILNLKKDSKSMNFDTKKIYLNTRDILSQWIQTTKKSTGISNNNNNPLSYPSSVVSSSNLYGGDNKQQLPFNYENLKNELSLPRVKHGLDLSGMEGQSGLIKSRRGGMVMPTSPIENRNQHRKRSIPITNYWKSSDYSLLNNSQNEVEREKRRINCLYPKEQRQKVLKLIFGLDMRSIGQVREVDYL